MRRLQHRPFGKALRAFLLLLLVSAGAITWSATRKTDPLVVNDISQLNPIRVAEVITPKSTEEIVEAVRTHSGGGRYSMGGQTATEGALHIDMRQFDRILALDAKQKSITVQAGTNWRQIQERIDAENLSVKVMQSYANFTVGGSLSVNAHGRYIGLGPIVTSVRSIKVVLPDGTLVEASRTENREIFATNCGINTLPSSSSSALATTRILPAFQICPS